MLGLEIIPTSNTRDIFTLLVVYELVYGRNLGLYQRYELFSQHVTPPSYAESNNCRYNLIYRLTERPRVIEVVLYILYCKTRKMSNFLNLDNIRA
jgi:hypothetical protein